MEYFKLYDIPVGFKVNERALKKKYFALSKQYHPDFHTDKNEAEQALMLEKSGMVNKAYEVLKDFDLRMKYILDAKGMLQEGKDKLPQMFLMEMMDINEQLMELEFDFDAQRLEQVQNGINTLKSNLLNEIQPIIEDYNDESTTDEELFFLKNYYLKHRYILRIQDNLNKFASA